MVKTFAVAALGRGDHGYDGWVTALTEASARLDALQTAVTEVRNLCERGDVDAAQILKALTRLGL